MDFFAGDDRPGRIPKASDTVVSAVRRTIARDKLVPGTRLPTELELAQEFGLGRATVREALRILERDGLVDIKRGPTGGVFVREASISRVSDHVAIILSMRGTELRDFVSYRLFIEPWVARLAAQNATDAQRKTLLEIASGDDPFKSSVQLHDYVAECAGNDVVEFVIKTMSAPLMRHFREHLLDSDDLDGTDRAHRKIAEKIAAGDADGAEAAMRRHLEGYVEWIEAHNLMSQPIVPVDRL